MSIDLETWEVDISDLPKAEREPLYNKLAGIGWDAYWNTPPYTVITVLMPRGRNLPDVISFPDSCRVRKV